MLLLCNPVTPLSGAWLHLHWIPGYAKPLKMVYLLPKSLDDLFCCTMNDDKLLPRRIEKKHKCTIDEHSWCMFFIRIVVTKCTTTQTYLLFFLVFLSKPKVTIIRNKLAVDLMIRASNRNAKNLTCWLQNNLHKTSSIIFFMSRISLILHMYLFLSKKGGVTPILIMWKIIWSTVCFLPLPLFLCCQVKVKKWDLMGSHFIAGLYAVNVKKCFDVGWMCVLLLLLRISWCTPPVINLSDWVPPPNPPPPLLQLFQGVSVSPPHHHQQHPSW